MPWGSSPKCHSRMDMNMLEAVLCEVEWKQIEFINFFNKDNLERKKISPAISTRGRYALFVDRWSVSGWTERLQQWGLYQSFPVIKEEGGIIITLASDALQTSDRWVNQAWQTCCDWWVRPVRLPAECLSVSLSEHARGRGGYGGADGARRVAAPGWTMLSDRPGRAGEG